MRDQTIISAQECTRLCPDRRSLERESTRLTAQVQKLRGALGSAEALLRSLAESGKFSNELLRELIKGQADKARAALAEMEEQ